MKLTTNDFLKRWTFAALVCLGFAVLVAGDQGRSNGQENFSNASDSFASLGEKAGLRQKMNLDGVWNFATDPENVGERDGWFRVGETLSTTPREGYSERADGTIRIPGIWENQGYGTPSDKIKSHFVGKGWFKNRETISIPKDWANQEIYFVLTGISRYAKVWINGKSAGNEAIGCIGSHEWEVGSLLEPGRDAEITIQIDSKQRWEIDALLGAASLNDYMEIAWGGIWGHAYLEARPRTQIDSVYLRSDIQRSICSAETTIRNEETARNADSLKIEVFDAQNEIVAEKTQKIDETTVSETSEEILTKTTVAVEIPNANLWSPNSPYLYNVRVSLIRDGEPLDVWKNRYGMREIRTDGSKLLLNGKRFVALGYGDDHIYPNEFSMPCNKETHLRRLRQIKEYGFNHVRHHSSIMPQEYYDACDEIGIMPTAEFLIGYPQQLPGEGELWRSRVPEGTDPEPALDVYRDRFAAVVREYRNHPCILCWVMGNELWEGKSIRFDFMKIAKTADPDRLFLDSDGDWKQYVVTKDRETTEMNMTLFDEWSSPIANKDKFVTGPLSKPALAHETGNYITFSQPNQIELFDSTTYKPFWMTDGKAKLEKLGLLDEADRWAKASENLYLLHHKANVEGIRLNPELTGYHLWLIQDYWTTSNGIFDLFFRPKSLKPEAVRTFNNEIVLLQQGLERTYRSGETATLESFVSNFSGEPISGTLTFVVESPDRLLLEVESESEIAEGTVASVERGEIEWPEVATPTPIDLSARFVEPNGRVERNHWKTWLFPKEIVPSSNGVAIFVDSSCRELLPVSFQQYPPIPNDETLSEKAVYLTGWLDQRVLNAAERGAGIVLLGGSQLLSATKIQYQQSWWKGGDSEESNHCGTFFYSNPITDSMNDSAPAVPNERSESKTRTNFDSEPKPEASSESESESESEAESKSEASSKSKSKMKTDAEASFESELKPKMKTDANSEPESDNDACKSAAKDDWGDAQWLDLLDGAEKYNVEKFERPQILIRALPSLVRVQDSAVLYEVGVGEGTLIVSGLNHQKAANRPENEWILAKMIERAVSPEKPSVHWDVSRLTPKESVPEGTFLGFRRLLRPGEASSWISYRENNVSGAFCRQSSKENRLDWETATLPDSFDAETATFIFAGGLGYATEPQTNGLSLWINDRESLTFDLPKEEEIQTNVDGEQFVVWKSPNGQLSLTFEIKRIVGPDYFGVFRLTVPKSSLNERKTQTFSVRSLGEGSRRWFGLNFYRDF